MGLTRTWRWWLAGGGAILALTLVLAAVVLYTDIGTPGSRYTYTVASPCDLLHEQTVRELAGDVSPDYRNDSGPGRSEWGLTRDTAVQTCHMSGRVRDQSEGTVEVSVYFFRSAQFHLGRSGEQQAEDLLTGQNEWIRDRLYPDGCSYEMRDGSGTACGMYDEEGAVLHLHRANVFVSVRVDFVDSFRERVEQPTDQLLGSLAEEALSQLDVLYLAAAA